MGGGSSLSPSSLCNEVPFHLSSFVDAFVDFSVSGGLFFPQNPKTPSPHLQTRHPSLAYLLAVGDLHDDLHKSLEALSLAGLVDDRFLRWTGGDVLDSNGLKLLYLLDRLKLDAARSGGSLLTMIENHEVMNIDGNFSFIRDGSPKLPEYF